MSNTSQYVRNAFAICGWSGSGKTWLIERLIQKFSSIGLKVGVLKHDAHQLELDQPGKNTYRFWNAGCECLLAHDSSQMFIRSKKSENDTIAFQVQSISNYVDFILIEGHKSLPLPKVWLEHPQKQGMPEGITDLLDVLPWDEDHRIQKAEGVIFKWFQNQFMNRPLRAGILTGGKSIRMGFPKEQLRWKGKSLIEHLSETIKPLIPNCVLIGNQPVPELLNSMIQVPDIPNGAGPMAGIISAMCWDPHCIWLFVACDMPLITRGAIQWLLAQRKPGKWIILPTIYQQIHPLLALYEPQAKVLFEKALLSHTFSLKELVKHPSVHQIQIPTEIQQSWMNCNTPDDWNQACKVIQHKDTGKSSDN